MEKTVIKNATLLNIDCIEYMKGLPDKHFDLAVCDPPYGIDRGGKPKSTSKHGGHKGYEYKNWDKYKPSAEYFDQLMRVSENCIIWGANYFSSFLRPSSGWVLWDKGQRIDQADGELAFTTFNKPLRIFTLNRVAIQIDGAIHPTQKPVKLYDWLLTNYAKPGQRILDTHGGSMSSVIAANNLGFEIVCCELDQDYYQTACERVAKHAQQERLFA